MEIGKDLQQAVANITIWRQGDQRAPHKPLLLLYALSRYKQGHARLFDYADVHGPMLDLLARFGPQRRDHYPALPFWRLTNDGFWSLHNAERCTRTGSRQPPKSELIKNQVAGGFDEPNFTLLQQHPALIDTLAQQILAQHFPASLQEIIADEMGFVPDSIDKSRDPRFRQQVLRAYNYQCAVCGFNLRHDDISVGVEAAHIKWKQFGGPCTVANGLALCSIHHRAFDTGSIGLDENMRIVVSAGVNGSDMVQRLFWDFAQRPLALPLSAVNYPDERFVGWHRQEVFKR